jgi:hypothetical protein
MAMVIVDAGVVLDVAAIDVVGDAGDAALVSPSSVCKAFYQKWQLRNYKIDRG